MSKVLPNFRVAEVVRLALEQLPKNTTHWRTRALAYRSSLSHECIARIWKAFGLRPHRHEHFLFPTDDPQFVDKVRPVVGLRLSPPSNAVVLCL